MSNGPLLDFNSRQLHKIKTKLTEESWESGGEDGEPVLVAEPGAEGEEGEVEGGGGREESCAGQEHPRRQAHHDQADPPYVRAKCHQDSAVKVHLGTR